MNALAWLQETGHWAAMMPLTAVALVWFRFAFRGRPPLPSPDVVLMACAFFVSFIADTMAAQLRAQGLPNLWLSYVYAPIQFGLLAVVFAPSQARRVFGIAVALVVVTSLLRNTFSAPETFVQVLVGAWIGLAVLQHPALGRYRWPVVLYCVGAIPFLLALGAVTPANDWPWITAWAGYQCVRVVALAWVTYAIIETPHLRLMEADNGRAGGAAGDREGSRRGAADTGHEFPLRGIRGGAAARTPRRRRTG